MSQTIPIIDMDIHPYASQAHPLDPFVPADFREAVKQGMSSAPGHGYSNPFGVNRRDAACEDPQAVARDHLDRHNIVYGVLQSPGMGISLTHNIDVGSALGRAWNDWQAETFLAADPRYIGSISVNMNDPQAAAAEIHRAAKHPRMRQVLVCGASCHLYGHRSYYPVYQACHDLDIPFALHPGREGSISPATPIGNPASYLEWHTLIPLTFQAHLVSMVAEGIFERFPRLKLILTEGGVSWLLNVMWRMDKNFKALRSTVPWLRRTPSEYILEHVRLTTQPTEEPDNDQYLLQLFDMIHAEKTLMFSSDFPHWDFDDPARAFPRKMSDDLRRRIFYDTAAEVLHLPPLASVGASREAADAREVQHVG
jgi:predicted TIM-barrel fold metal-dependent hydrolase